MHPHSIIASILVCGVIAVVAMVKPRGEETIVGDFPWVPMELRLPDRKAGGAAEQGRGAVTDDIARHVGTAAK